MKYHVLKDPDAKTSILSRFFILTVSVGLDVRKSILYLLSKIDIIQDWVKGIISQDDLLAAFENINSMMPTKRTMAPIMAAAQS